MTELLKNTRFSTSTASTSSVFGQCRPVSSFEKLGRIGEGTYGTVYKAFDKDTKNIVALKRIIMHNEKHDGFPLTSIREIATLRKTNHPNCVKMLDVVVGHKRDGVFLVFEYCEHDISALLDNVRTPFSESEIKSLVYQLLSAVAYLHDRWIIHRDIKLSNLLYNNKGEVKLADFGLARTFPSHFQPQATGREEAFRGNRGGRGDDTKRLFSTEVPMTLKVVTLWYRAPELLLGAETYSTAIDVWAVGCVLGELLLGRPLLPGDNELDQIHRIFALLGCPSARIWADLPTMKVFSSKSSSSKSADKSENLSYSLNLSQEQKRYPFSNLQEMFPCPSKIGDNGLECLNSMLTYDPKRRITARDSRRHLYFSSSPHPKEPDMMPTFPCQHDDLQELSGDSRLYSKAAGVVEELSCKVQHVEDSELVKEKNTRVVSSTSFASALATSYSVSSNSKKRSGNESGHNGHRHSNRKRSSNINRDASASRRIGVGVDSSYKPFKERRRDL